jgi:hypothetical protein
MDKQFKDDLKTNLMIITAIVLLIAGAVASDYVW